MVLTTGSAFYIVPQYRFIGTAHSGEIKVAFSLDLDLFISLSLSLSLSLWRSSSEIHQYSSIPTWTNMSDFISVRLSQLFRKSSAIFLQYQWWRHDSAEAEWLRQTEMGGVSVILQSSLISFMKYTMLNALSEGRGIIQVLYIDFIYEIHSNEYLIIMSGGKRSC